MMLHSVAGITGILVIAWLTSESRRQVPWRVVCSGLLLLFVLALLLLKLPAVREVFGLNAMTDVRFSKVKTWPIGEI